MKSWRALLRDEGGQATVDVLGFSLTWFVVFFVFLMNVQLGQLFHRHDVVTHAASVAADSAMKTYCAKNGGDRAFSEQEAHRAIDPLIATATNATQACKLTVRPATGQATDPGATDLDVFVECSFDCSIPIAAQVMCKEGRTSFASKLKTTALGCDGKGG